MRVVFLAALLSVLAPLFLHAQSLGAAARQEQAKKRKAPASPVPTYTEDDLKSRSGAAKESGSPPGVSAPSPAASAESSPTPEPDRALLEREWRARFREARARIAEAEARAYEDRVEPVLVNGFYVQQWVRVRVETAELRAARKALEDLEEELRRSGGLPGWGRE
jgi:hypothetical protein